MAESMEWDSDKSEPDLETRIDQIDSQSEQVKDSNVYQIRPQCDNRRIAIIAYMTEKKSPYGLADFKLAKELWTRLKFKVIPIKNPRWEDLQREVTRVVTKINNNSEVHDVFSFTFVGHGGREERQNKGNKYKFEFIKLIDRCVDVDELRGMFSAFKCPGLLGKAKLFFLQCCRGKNWETPFNLPACAAEISENVDFYSLNSCVPGFVSLYNTSSGQSDFIATLCKVFKREFKFKDIINMATTVIRELPNKRQTVEQTSTLSKQLYFRGAVIMLGDHTQPEINPSDELSYQEDGGGLIDQYQELANEGSEDGFSNQDQELGNEGCRDIFLNQDQEHSNEEDEDCLSTQNQEPDNEGGGNKKLTQEQELGNEECRDIFLNQDQEHSNEEDEDCLSTLNQEPDNESSGNKKLTQEQVTLRDICLDDVLSFNFGMKDILTIRKSSVKIEEPQTLKDNLLYIISKMVMLDYHSRNLKLPFQCNENKDKSSIPENNVTIDSSDDEFESILKGTYEVSLRENTNLLHPSDVIVIIMNCCDNFLKNLIIQKMSMCQLAIPLVFPDFHSDEPLFLLSAMRFMNMDLKTKVKRAHDLYPVDNPTPIISAMRFGDLPRSKSKVLNEILCNQPHNIFFHSDCEAESFSRKLSNGVVELSWFLPGGIKEDTEDTFDNMMAIANLRDDAKYHSKQFELLNKISSVMLIFLTSQSISDNEICLMLQKLSKSTQQLVFIFFDTLCQQNSIIFKNLMGDKKFNVVLGSKNGQEKNIKKLTIDLRKKINISLKQHLETYSIAEPLSWKNISRIACSTGIQVDEKNKACKQGKSMANININNLRSNDVITMKEQVLPLQGEFWSKWSRLTKDQARLDGVLGKDIEHYISDLISQKNNCRKKQCKLVDQITPAMNNFIKNLIQTKDKPETRINFMQWMKFYLDEMSYDKLPELRKKYSSLWNDIQVQKDKEHNVEENKRMQKELDKVEKDLINSSFGLEHFIRELGQVYEAIIENKNNTFDKFNHLHVLPHIAAKLLLSGYPLEIMDGDVGHMPLTWVNAVFDSLKSELGDKRLFVISILGVQSSGKSTLLNTMFGLKFAVSAGRCTKGVFAQLIPVENHLSNELGYDYILVLDTEGLRASEIGNSKLKHDNELATLVIGMGDVTIVNIKGENTSEIEDILQICVHAFIRMKITNKSLKLQPGCYFVHQNVPAVDADEKMAYGYKKILEKLDMMAEAAAKQEGARNIRSFKDVIDFNAENNVWYFSSLWQGDPPMAPANPSYSKKVLELKTNLLKYPSQKEINCLTFSDLQLRMSDLWNALLYEHFVFSFKNTLEVKSYNNLEEKYSILSWKFRNEIKEWTNGSLNEILSCEEKNVINLHSSIIYSLGICIDTHFPKYRDELDTFFTSSKDKDILVKWKIETDIKLKSLSDELKREARKTCESYFEIRRAQFVSEDKIHSYRKQLHNLVKKLVSTNLKEKMSDESLNKMFAEKWNEWMKLLGFEEMEKKDIFGDVFTILAERYKKNSKVLQIEIARYIPTETKHCDLDTLPYICEEDFKISHLEKWKKYCNIVFSMDYKEPIIEIKKFTRELMNNIQTYLNERKHLDYDKNVVYEIYNIVNEKIKTNNNSRPYELLITYSIKVTVHILMNIVPLFEIRHKDFREKNDPQHFLEQNFKPQLQKFFLGTVTQCMQEKTAADILCASIKEPILASLKRDLPRIIAANITSSNLKFQTKIDLFVKILEDLGTEKNFDMYQIFIDYPDESMKSWLKFYVSEYCTIIKENGKSNLSNAANKILSQILFTLKNGIKEVNESVNAHEISFQEWLKRLQNLVKRTFPLYKVFDILDGKNIKDITFFEERVNQGLDNLQMMLEKQIREWSVEDLYHLDEIPHELIAANILGCTERCPFCGAICTHTIAGHAVSHSNPHHRPQGIGGVHYSDSHILVLKSCNVLVASDGTFCCRDRSCQCFMPYGKLHRDKEYAAAGPLYASWSIPPDTSLDGSAYWKWVFLMFGAQIAQYGTQQMKIAGDKNQIKCPAFPSSWRRITWEQAKESIRKSV